MSLTRHTKLDTPQPAKKSRSKLPKHRPAKSTTPTKPARTKQSKRSKKTTTQAPPPKSAAQQPAGPLAHIDPVVLGEIREAWAVFNGQSGRMTQAAATSWREVIRLCIAVDEQPDDLKRIIVMGIERGAWRNFNDPDGQPFETFDAFCACPDPYGLGRSADEVVAALERLLGKKATQLVTVRAARQGRRNDLTQGTSRHEGGKSGSRNEERLRAIDQGPAAIRRLFQSNLVGINEAARVAARADDPATVELIRKVEAVAEEPDLPLKSTRQRINQIVQQTLDQDKPLRAALAAYRKLSRQQQALFLREIGVHLGDGAADTKSVEGDACPAE